MVSNCGRLTCHDSLKRPFAKPPALTGVFGGDCLRAPLAWAAAIPDNHSQWRLGRQNGSPDFCWALNNCLLWLLTWLPISSGRYVEVRASSGLATRSSTEKACAFCPRMPLAPRRVDQLSERAGRTFCEYDSASPKQICGDRSTRASPIQFACKVKSTLAAGRQHESVHYLAWAIRRLASWGLSRTFRRLSMQQSQ